MSLRPIADFEGESTPRPASAIVLVRTRDHWWQVEESDPVTDLQLSMRVRRALHSANLYRAAEVRDLDLDLFAARRGLGWRTVEEIALLRGVLRYRSRSLAPDRAAFEAALPRNRIPLSWQIALKADGVESLDLSKRARDAVSAAGVATVGDLLDLSLVELRVRSGVGPKTELELGDLFEVLHRRFAGTSRPRGRLGPWPAQVAIAADLGISISSVHGMVVRARAVWRHHCRYRIHKDLKNLLEAHGGVATPADLAEDLLALRGSSASPEVRRLRAWAVVRATQSRAKPRGSGRRGTARAAAAGRCWWRSPRVPFVCAGGGLFWPSGG